MTVYISEKWNEKLSYFEDTDKDIYFTEEYVKLYESHESKCFAIICEESDNIMIFPFLRKKIGEYYDFETAYGYGGPISNCKTPDWNKQAIEAMFSHFSSENYLCGFIRFHTMMNNYLMCKDIFPVIFDRNTVMMDTSVSPEEIWARQISSKNRNMIRKAIKNELVFRAEYDFESLKEFEGLYNQTMSRLGAEQFYFFDEHYYDSFVKAFSGNAFLGTVRKEEKLICAAIFMYSKAYGHYHLEGSDDNYKYLGANNFLLWNAAIEFNKLGVKKFHLGGGSNSGTENSLLKFKKAFSKDSLDFYIGKMIFNNEKYQEIKDIWCRDNPDKIENYGKLLLCYRY